MLSFLLAISLNAGWMFHLGNASDPQRDFGCGTEYFTYLSKAASIHNSGPYALSFNDSTWTPVTLPHDWAVTLPYTSEGSHSHGYKAIGWRYPENSVGWYRRTFAADTTWRGNEVYLCFDGIYRDARIWVNGFYVGHEESGYTTQRYLITDYLDYNQPNLICVRVDASLEEGWFYEGAGIYRDVYLDIQPTTTLNSVPELVEGQLSTLNSHVPSRLKHGSLPHNLRGVNLHHDHAGVGIAVPRGLLEYRLRRLQSIGVNAIRCSHNPASPDLLDLCDSLGLYVISETRLMGSNDLQYHVVENMIQTGKSHPCVIAWSVGNEEWGIEWSDRGEAIARRMSEWCHALDPTRPTIVATSSGPNVLLGTDLAGYNYIVQNDIDGLHQRYPNRIAIGTEETTGCGTRGVYFTDTLTGRMASINRTNTSYENVIERGLKFYAERPWLLGLFYWTGFDYMGEPNPMKWPACGSQFGILDACGFPKDEAYYLQSWWTDKPTLHILPHWNLEGHEGDSVAVWVYSNMDEVELKVNGRSLGRKSMPQLGHLSWATVYQPGKVEAIGYRDGRRVLREVVETAGEPTQMDTTMSVYDDICIVDITLRDARGRFTPTACVPIGVSYADATLLGVGNGDPMTPETALSSLSTFNTFNGHAQLIFRSRPSHLTLSLHP